MIPYMCLEGVMMLASVFTQTVIVLLQVQPKFKFLLGVSVGFHTLPLQAGTVRCQSFDLQLNKTNRNIVDNRLQNLLLEFSTYGGTLSTRMLSYNSVSPVENLE